jgi:hypothetical protein
VAVVRHLRSKGNIERATVGNQPEVAEIVLAGGPVLEAKAHDGGGVPREAELELAGARENRFPRR